MYINDEFQVSIFLLSLGLGFLLALTFDLFETIHNCIFKNGKYLIVKDIIYCVIASVICFLFLLTVNYGRIRVFLIIGTVVGFLCWQIFLSNSFVKQFSSIILKFFTAINAVSVIISFPFRAFYSSFMRIFSKNTTFFKEFFNKTENILKIHLKKK